MTLMDVSHKPRRPRRRPLVYDRIAHLCWLMEAEVDEAFAVPVEALRARSRGTARVAFARQSAMYLAHVALGLSYSRIGRMLRRDRTTAAHACLLVELRRDDPTIDCRLDTLERACVELAREYFDSAAGASMSIAGRRAANRAPETQQPDIGEFRARHLAVGQRQVETDFGPANVTVDEGESPLAWLARRRGRDGRALYRAASIAGR